MPDDFGVKELKKINDNYEVRVPLFSSLLFSSFLTKNEDLAGWQAGGRLCVFDCR